MFLNTLDAQTQAVAQVIERYNLEQTYSTYNNVNDPTGSIRLALKVQIKNAQVIIDNANIYVTDTGLNPIIYNQMLVSPSGLVTTPWSNEAEIPNTVLNYLQATEVSTTQLISSQSIATASIANTVDILTANQAALTQAMSLDDSNPQKEDAVAAAQDDFSTTQSQLEQLINNQAQITSTINNIQSVPSPLPPTDTFSLSIRQQIHNTLAQKAGYDPTQNNEEAAMVMRRKALDAFYTASTPSEKQVAVDRLNRVAAALDPSVPITYSTYTYDPNAYYELLTNLSNADTLLSTLITALQVAIEGGNPTTIAAAQAAYNAQMLVKTNLIDTIQGYRDSTGSMAMYPGSLDAATQAPLPPTLSSSNSETNDTFNALARQNNGTIVGPNQLYNRNNGQVVNPNQIGANQSGTYITSRGSVNVTDFNTAVANYSNQAAVQNAQAQSAITGLQQARDLQSSAINAQLAVQQQDANSSDPAIAATAQANITNLNAQQVQINQTYTTNAAPFQATIQQNNNIANAQIASYVAPSTPPASIDEANAVLSNYQTTQASTNVAEQQFNNARQIAIQNAQTNGSATPTDPSTWSDADVANVSSQQSNLEAARANEAAAGTLYNNYATNVPGGAQSLQQAGQSPAQIQSTVSQTLLSQNNNTAPQPDNSVGFSNTANSIDPSNVRPSNGFEQINNGAPFYMQFPTLQSITDFHLRNGISPYGQQTQDEVARHAVHFNIFEVTPPAMKAQLVPGTSGLVQNVVGTANSNTLGTFTIYPSNLDLDMRHEHTYSNENYIPDLINSALDIVNGADTLFTLAATVANSVASGREQGIPQKLTRKLDTIDKYTGTDRQTGNLEFCLFTRSDFLSDIFRPLMFLTALSYPKRELTGNLGNGLAAAAKGASQAASQSNNQTIQYIQQVLQKTFPGVDPKKIADFLNGADQTLAETGGIGPYRYFITKNPEYISIRHASGIFYYPLAVITGVSYTFHGPWYNYAGQPIAANGNFGDMITSSINNAAAPASFQDIINQFTQSAAFTGASPGGPPGSLASLQGVAATDPQIAQYRLPFAYPSYASCNISYKSALPMFRDDYLQLFYEAGKPTGGSGIVTVTQQQTATLNNSVPRVF